MRDLLLYGVFIGGLIVTMILGQRYEDWAIVIGCAGGVIAFTLLINLTDAL